MLIENAIARAKKDAGVSTDDTSLGNRYIYSILKSVRAELLRQEVEKKGLSSGFTLQTLSRFELEEVDILESQDVVGQETVLKSKLPFPELMETKEAKITGGFFLPTGERIDLLPYTAVLNSVQRRYRTGKGLAYLRNNHVYIKYYEESVSKLFLDIDGLFADPEEVDRLNEEKCDASESCIYYPKLPFYLPSYLEGRFFRMVKEDATWSYRVPKDKTNNGTEDIGQVAQTKE